MQLASSESALPAGYARRRSCRRIHRSRLR